jgi:uncharacterized RDD family membrane protein YckC
MAYEGLLLLALLFVATFVFLAVFGSAIQPPKRYLLQCWLLIVAGCYFVWFWTHGGQTLAMKTWRLRLVTEDGNVVAIRTAILRFFAAVPSVGLGVGVIWAMLDGEGRFLHDRLAHTRLIVQSES